MKQHIIEQKINNVKLRILVTINNEQCIVWIPTPQHLYVQPLTQHPSYCPALRFSKVFDPLL
jgi:hypothetical protein